MLNGIVQEEPDSTRFNEIKSEMEQGILNITAGNGKHAMDAMNLLRGFAGRERARHTELEEVSIRTNTPIDFSNHIHSAVRNTLREHMCCTCGKGVASGKHLAELLLQVPTHLDIDSSQAAFNMLFSSTPAYNECFSGRWQDVHLRVSQ